ncbi:MAG: hypothetical protein PHO70_07715 [Candidatus Omnitrophica bacterium]|nr:hypothetical protein [Candidatus Omnitrophota bacterium]
MRIKNTKGKSIVQKLKFLIPNLIFAFCVLVFASNCFAKEITVLFTGDTHAMLYPCSCPKEPDGGVARRATLIKQLKKQYPEALLVDSGGFTGSGQLDEYSLNTQLDKDRTKVAIKAMQLMKYDAVAVGDEEFNFGREFFQDNIANSGLPLLSCNIENDKILPYIIKDVSGVKIGIVGLISIYARQKAEGLKFVEPKSALTGAISELRKKGVDVILLLSQQNELEDLNLIKEVKGVDILIMGSSRPKEEPVFENIDGCFITYPIWQGRKLSKMTFSFNNKKISDFKVENIRLSDKISYDKEILSILPKCFSDSNCKKEGMIGVCNNAGTLNASCSFSQPAKLKLTVITSKACVTCNPAPVVESLKRYFPGLAVTYVNYPDDKRSLDMIKQYVISGLPAYLFGKEIENDKNFTAFKANLDARGEYYLLKPQASGVSYFLERKKTKGTLDLFLSLYNKDTEKLLGIVKEFSPNIHFLAVDNNGQFDAAAGRFEVEEYERAVCVQKYYPEKFWDYLTCRAQNISSSWWEDCAAGLDVNKIKNCAKGQEGAVLLKNNIGLNKEIQAMFGPAYLMDNQEIFATKGVPSKEELKKILKR